MGDGPWQIVPDPLQLGEGGQSVEYLFDVHFLIAQRLETCHGLSRLGLDAKHLTLYVYGCLLEGLQFFGAPGSQIIFLLE